MLSDKFYEKIGKLLTVGEGGKAPLTITFWNMSEYLYLASYKTELYS